MESTEQKTTQFQAVAVINKLPITYVEKMTLTNFVNVYSFLCSNDVHMNASFQDVMRFVLEQQGYTHNKDINDLLETLD